LDRHPRGQPRAGPDRRIEPVRVQRRRRRARGQRIEPIEEPAIEKRRTVDGHGAVILVRAVSRDARPTERGRALAVEGGARQLTGTASSILGVSISQVSSLHTLSLNVPTSRAGPWAAGVNVTVSVPCLASPSANRPSPSTGVAAASATNLNG